MALKGKILEPEDIETDPLLRFALRRGAGNIRANQREIERELGKRLAGLEMHPVELVKADMAEKAEAIGLAGFSERFNVPDFQDCCKIGYEMALADLMNHIETVLYGKTGAYKIRQHAEELLREIVVGLEHKNLSQKY